MDRQNQSPAPVNVPLMVSAGLFSVVVFLIFVFAVWGIAGLIQGLAGT